MVSAICGRNEARGRELAARSGIPNCYTDYRQMIDEGNLDAVIVYTPEVLHYPMTMAALDAGLHAICEKPIAISVAQARECRDGRGKKSQTHGELHQSGRAILRYLKSLPNKPTLASRIMLTLSGCLAGLLTLLPTNGFLIRTRPTAH